MSKKALRLLIPLPAGFVGFLLSFTYACDAVGGVPSWERCISPFGTPVPEWSALVSLAIGIVTGVLVWWLLRLTPLKSSGKDSGRIEA